MPSPEPLNATAILRQLQQLQRWEDHLPNPPDHTLAFQIHCLASVASTNEVVWDWLNQGAANASVAIATKQKRGRGQRGHAWSSAPGGLYLSLGLRLDTLDLPMDQIGRLLFGTAWGIASGLRQHGIPVGLKWPNDLLLQGQKLGGILIETRIRQQQVSQAVVGVGLNWENRPPPMGIALKPTLGDNPSIQTLEELAAIVLYGLQRSYSIWITSAATFEQLSSSYLNLLTHWGQAVDIEGRRGQVIGVNALGQLRVRWQDLLPSDYGNPEQTIQPGERAITYLGTTEPYSRT